MISPPTTARRAWTLFAGWLLLCVVLFARPLTHLVQFAAHNDDASHILLVPLISAWLLFSGRRKLAVAGHFDLLRAVLFAALAVIALVIGTITSASTMGIALTAYIAAFLLLVVAGFMAIFGSSRDKQCSFALGFLIFAVPLPQSALDRVIAALQTGSAAVAEAIFDVCGVPALRDGFVFRMPRISIEVAAECSGIRSSMALLILAVLVAHFSFRPFWKKAVFVAAGLVMMVVKNGARIATLTILANYVNPDFLYGRLHRQGGVVFFLLGCALLLPLYWLLRRNESGSPQTADAKA